MTKRNIVILLVVFIIALVIITVCYCYYLLPAPPLSEFPSKIEGPEEVVPPPATGNIDDVADALLKELFDEDTVLEEEEGDTTLVTTDSQEIGDFGQSIDESELQ